MDVPVSDFHDYRHVDKTFYIDSDTQFYEPNYRHYTPSDELFAVVRNIVTPVCGSWTVGQEDVWTHITPIDIDGSPSVSLPDQGWKIHISATNLNCLAILHKASLILVNDRIPFKFANDTETLRMMTSKRWTRGGSGKFMTIYPVSLTQFKDIIERLYLAIAGENGSYILSDKRYKDSKCVYYRYGGIRLNESLHFAGRRVPVLKAPDGKHIIDRRNAYFTMPDWVSDPFPDSTPDDEPEATLNAGRYHIIKALSFSNTGGVYLAEDRHDRARVVIKEARPFTELSKSGEDATLRLESEARLLSAAEALGVTPRLRECFWDWENFYLVEDYIDGIDIRNFMLENSPLLKVYPNPHDSADFYAKYQRIIVSLIAAVQGIHEAGIILGDLSPANILVLTDTYEVRIIDLEGAYRPGTDSDSDLHTPGFRTRQPGRPNLSTPADDIYAIGVIMMYSIFPVAALAYIRNDVYSEVFLAIVKDAGLEHTSVFRVAHGLLDGSMPLSEALLLLSNKAEVCAPTYNTSLPLLGAELDGAVSGMADFICSNIRLSDSYTLFPIDPFGSLTNSLGFGFGASGIVYALHTAGVDIPFNGLERYRREMQSTDCSKLPPGLLTGSSGIAWASFLSNDAASGIRFLDEANRSPISTDHHSLYHGMSGVGLVNLGAYHETGEYRYLEAAIGLAKKLQNNASESDRGIFWDDGDAVRVGFGYGQSGVALFMLRLSQATGEPLWREIGKRALEFDISFGIEIEPNVVGFGADTKNVTTLENYVEQGSSGIAKVALRYGITHNIDVLLAGSYRKYSLFPGLIYGLGSFVDTLIDAFVLTGDIKYIKMAERPVSGLMDLYIHQRTSGYAVPGDSLFRISCDYATGVAGVLHVLNRFSAPAVDRLWLDDRDGRSA